MDTLVVPFIFVPHGEPVPTEWLSRHRDPIRVPARFVPRRPTFDRTTAQSDFGAAFDPAGPSTLGDEHAHLAAFETAEPEHRSTWTEPHPVKLSQEDPVAAYMRIDEFLDGLGLGHSARANRTSISDVADTVPGAPDPPRLVANGSPSRDSSPASPQAAMSGGDPNRPVPLVDDQGHPVLNEDGNPILRPAGLDPHFFIKRGLEDKHITDGMLSNGGTEGAAAATAYQAWELSRFLWWQPWDAQRVGAKYHREFVDYATVVIGLYAAAAGMTRDEILTLEDVAAAIGSHFNEEAERDAVYKHLRVDNVRNTDLGYQLFLSGSIK